MRLGRWGIAAGIAVLTVSASVATVAAAAAESGGQAPIRFVAQFDDRIAVVSAETGRVERYLSDVKPGGGAHRPAVSPDGRTVWFSRSDGSCAAHLASVPVSGGKEEKLPGSGEAGPETVPLPRPGRPQLAFARVDCQKPDAALIVGDIEGVEGHGQSGLVPLAWSRDGSNLLARTATSKETRLLTINKAGGIVSNDPLEPPDTVADCRLEVVGFSPDDNDGYVAFRRCGPSDERGRRSLVLLEQNGNLRKTVVRLSRNQDFTDRPAFDHTGHSLLYATVLADADQEAADRNRQASLWVWRDGESRRLERQTRFLHPVWLP